MTSAAKAAPLEPQAAAGTRTPVDLAHLGRYTLGNTELEREVLALFAEQALSTLDSLRKASSPKAWREAAHTLKGAALAVGAWQVATCGQQAEIAEFSASNRDAILPRLEQAIADARSYIACL